MPFLGPAWIEEGMWKGRGGHIDGASIDAAETKCDEFETRESVYSVWMTREQMLASRKVVYQDKGNGEWRAEGAQGGSRCGLRMEGIGGSESDIQVGGSPRR